MFNLFALNLYNHDTVYSCCYKYLAGYISISMNLFPKLAIDGLESKTAVITDFVSYVAYDSSLPNLFTERRL